MSRPLTPEKFYLKFKDILELDKDLYTFTSEAYSPKDGDVLVYEDENQTDIYFQLPAGGKIQTKRNYIYKLNAHEAPEIGYEEGNDPNGKWYKIDIEMLEKVYDMSNELCLIVKGTNVPLDIIDHKTGKAGEQTTINEKFILGPNGFTQNKTFDIVNKPSHYTSGKIEVIDFIEDQKLGFHLGNVVKYIARAGKKDPSKEIQDLEKAKWYLERQINNLKKI